jgi:uncharacterized protein (DUF3084 family)
MTNKRKVPWYKVLETSFINEQFLQAGEYVQYAGSAGPNLEEATEEDARKAGKEIAKPTDDRLENFEADLNEREAELADREVKLQLRQQEIDKLEEAHNQRNQELNEREAELQKREALILPGTIIPVATKEPVVVDKKK